MVEREIQAEGKKHGPQAQIETIEELTDRVKLGNIKLPKFQRAFIWDRQDILKLCDSIYNGYPVGSVLLWFTSQKLVSERKIGDLTINDRNYDEYPVNYLLDGQQRLSTLCGALHWNGENLKSKWNIWFDLERETFSYLDSSPEAKHFPLNKILGDPFDVMAQIANCQDSPQVGLITNNLNKLIKAFKYYKMPVITIGEMTIKEVTPIFERINSTGRRLTVADLTRAATWTESFDLSDAISEIQEALAPKGFEEITESEVLQAVSVSRGEGWNKEDIDSLRKLTPSELKFFCKITRDAYSLAVDFISVELKIHSPKLVPYKRQLTLITEFFRICKQPSYEQRQCLKQWFWYTTFSSYFGSLSYGDLREALAEIRELARGEIKSIKDFQFSRILETRGLQEDFSFTKAFTKGFALMLMGNNPRSLSNGAVLDPASLSDINTKQYHHIFPKSFLKKNRISEPSPSIHTNYCLLPKLENIKISNKSPSDYLSEIITRLGATDAYAIFATNFLDKKCIAACLSDDYEEFIKCRNALLSKRIKSLSGDSP